jgi:hypothetical protein
MLVASALCASLLAAAIAADGMPTRALGRAPTRARQRVAAIALPALAILQYAALAATLGPAAALALLACAWMLAGWGYVLLLERTPGTVRRIGYLLGGMAALATAALALFAPG